MGEWNYNQYPPGYTWNNSRNNPGHPAPDMNYYRMENTNNIPQQPYVGFQDFVNQFQQSNSYQTFNGFQNQHVSVNYNHRYPVGHSDGPNFMQNNQQLNYGIPRNFESDENKFHPNAQMATGNPRVPYNPVSNSHQAISYVNNHTSSSSSTPQYQDFSSSESAPNQYHQSEDYNVASSSKLTATASEFVPQGSKTDSKTFHNSKMTNKTQDVSIRKDDKLNSPSRGGYKNKNNISNDSSKNTNWRKRDDEEPSFSGGGANVCESQIDGNSMNQQEGRSSSSRSDMSSFRQNKKEVYYNKSKYSENNSNYFEGNRNFKNSKTFNSNSNRQNYDNGTKYMPKKHASFSSNETFRQKNYKKNDQYVDKENIQETDDSNNGAIKKNKNVFSKTFVRKDLDVDKNLTGVSQRERLTEQLDKGILECLVCCERIRQTDPIWSCKNCFHVLHLKCILKWVKSSVAEGTWRCPACQNNNSIVPIGYQCFCGKQYNPEWKRGSDSAHTCGDICGRLPMSCLRHPCTLLCHPGPCPQCDAVVQKKCECGATSRAMKCSHNQPLICDNICNKPLNCQVHKCEEKCHSGSCQPCNKTVDQQCFCLKSVKRTLPCTAETVGNFTFSCEDVCDKKLACGNHNCVKICHRESCDECDLLPKNITKCPCSQTILTLEQKRESCLDPVPLCEKICSKIFDCGPPDNRHKCKSKCHHGNCPSCPDSTQVACRCGHMNKNLKCVDLESERDNVRCGKKCSKKQSCGRHRCKTLCCVDTEHRCMLPCNRSLTCGIHRCEDTCHNGHCDPCWRTSFDELRCRCGEAVMYPPIPCGTRPPACSKPCPVPRPCGHPPLHACHPAPSACTPCTVLTTKYCHGRHKMRKTIPCHQEEFSCGLACGKELSCTKHKCIETCHKGNCPTSCTQQCETERPGCGHPCGGSCGHSDPCPILVPCKRPVRVTCSCGRRSATKPCAEHMRDLQRLQANAGMLAGAMGKPIDIKELIAKGNTTTTLECDDDCQIEERNRRLAIGLQIRNPDLSAKLTPRYSDFMKQFAVRDEGFCNKIHEKLTELVTLAQNSKQKTRSHSFQPMNHQKRQFVHEMCDHFGCDSVAYDTEPYRNIVATAYREKSWLPALSLMEVIRRDKGQRRVPGPIVTVNSNNSTNSLQKPLSGGAWATLSMNFGSSDSARLVSATSVQENNSQNLEPPKPRIDYFDAPPED